MRGHKSKSQHQIVSIYTWMECQDSGPDGQQMISDHLLGLTWRLKLAFFNTNEITLSWIVIRKWNVDIQEWRMLLWYFIMQLSENYKEIKTLFLFVDEIAYHHKTRFLQQQSRMIYWLRATSSVGRVLGTGFSLWNTFLFSHRLVGGSWESIPAIPSPLALS